MSSCIHIREKSETYSPPQSLSSPTLRGAVVMGQMDPQDGRGSLSFSAMVYGFAAGTRMGPYQFQLIAVGREGRHQEMRVHGVTYRLGTGAVWKEPDLELALVKRFEPTYRKGFVQAFWKSVGLLPFDFESVEKVTVEVDVSIVDGEGIERRTIQLPFVRATERETEFVMAGVEIFDRIKNRKVPFEQLGIGANSNHWVPPAGLEAVTRP